MFGLFDDLAGGIGKIIGVAVFHQVLYQQH